MYVYIYIYMYMCTHTHTHLDRGQAIAQQIRVRERDQATARQIVPFRRHAAGRVKGIQPLHQNMQYMQYITHILSIISCYVVSYHVMLYHITLYYMHTMLYQSYSIEFQRNYRGRVSDEIDTIQCTVFISK